MTLPRLFLIAVALAMDAFAVSVAYGFDLEQVHPRRMTAIALVFGVFQAGMPLLGWIAGRGFYDWIAPVDHWVVFLLLGGLGVKMIYESIVPGKSGPVLKYEAGMLLLMGLATSIDALTVGLSLALLEVRILGAVVVIGVVTFVLSYLGVYIGRVFGKVWSGRVNILGGLILFFIGLGVLLKHLKGA